MTVQEHPASSLADRVQKLELQCRRLKLSLIGLIIVTLSLGSLSIQTTDLKGKSVTTEKLILQDASGKVRGTWTLVGASPYLTLLNEDQTPLVFIGKCPDTSAGCVSCFDSQGRLAVGLGGKTAEM